MSDKELEKLKAAEKDAWAVWASAWDAEREAAWEVELKEQPSQPDCPTCGSDEPFRGACGASDSDTKALCKQAAQPVSEPLQTQIDALTAKQDKLLDHCPDPECMTCGEIACPHGEPLHFHHDGCPACAEFEAIGKAQA